VFINTAEHQITPCVSLFFGHSTIRWTSKETSVM
jgi:hypothetical protein